MKLPGVAWTALALALTGVLGGWLTEYVQQPWVPMLVLVLNFIGSAVQTYFQTKAQTEVTARELMQPQRSFMSRVLFG